MDDLAHTVAKRQAAEDIRHLKARYARVCDTGYKPAGMVELFTSDAAGYPKAYGAPYVLAIGTNASNPQYFTTMGIPLHRGRDVEDGDRGDRAWVAVVSASFANAS